MKVAQRTMIATQTKLLYQVGFWAALVAFVGAVGYIVSAFLQVLNVVSPLQDAIIGFGTSLLIPVPFLLTMLVLHYTIAQEKSYSSGRMQRSPLPLSIPRITP